MSEWISSLRALQELRAAGVAEPVSTLTHLAESQAVRARALWGRFQGGDNDEMFPQEPDVDPQSGDELAPWPKIPASFWRWVNEGTPGTEIHGDAGVFAATVVHDPDKGEISEREFIKLFGVTFNADDLGANLRGVPLFHHTPALPASTLSKAGRKPELERWAEFGAAIALVAHTTDGYELRSEDALYAAAADALTSAGREPLSKKTVRMMVKNTLLWLGGDAIPPRFPEA